MLVVVFRANDWQQRDRKVKVGVANGVLVDQLRKLVARHAGRLSCPEIMKVSTSADKAGGVLFRFASVS